MKRIITLLLAFYTIMSSISFGQKLNYERTSPWFFGANIGAAWQNTDVKNQTNYGWGLVLGRTFNRDYANILSFDVKLRYLGGAWRGQNNSKTEFSDYTNTTLSSSPTDYKSTYGYSINNFQTKAHELNVELSMHFNRLTERTGLDPYIFGGIGATFYRAKGDLLDQMEYMYDYNLLDDYKQSTLSTFKDKNYETDLDGSKNTINGGIMTHLGVGIGYYFTPNFTMGFEHKTTFSGVDKFDGVISNHGKYKQDIYHYTSVYLKVYFNRARAKEDPIVKPTNPVNPTTPVNPNPVTCLDPIIQLRTANNSTVNQPTFTVEGTIQNATLSEVTSTLNGIQSGNLNIGNNASFQGVYQLQQGINTIVLTAQNTCGTATQTVYVNYVPACDNPIVTFTNPRTATVSTTSPSFTVQAQLTNLANGLIQFYVNGQQSSNFSFNTNTGLLTSSIALQNGVNSIQIIASNNCGSHTQSVNISYDRACPPPLFASNGQPSTVVSTKQIQLETYIRNISNASQVEVFLNGRAQSDGAYNNPSERFTKTLTLNSGTNSIVIRATNTCGTAEQTLQYDYREPCNNPTVAFTNPSGPRTTSTVKTYTLQAILTNITDAQTISLRVNNVAISNFNYNIQTGLLTATIQLTNGSNVVELNAQNACGSASTSATISYLPPCEKPLITWRNPTSTVTSQTATYNIEAVIKNINNANDVQVRVNGTLQATGTYDFNSSLYKSSIQLQRGTNTIQILASNYCGETTSTTSITYKGAIVVAGSKPTISFTNACNVKIAAGKILFSGTILDVTNTSQIQIKLQGLVHTEVNYTPISNGFKFDVELRVGYSQTIKMEVSAANQHGTTTQVCQITTEDAPAVDKDIVICQTINGIQQTLYIKESQWPNYQRLGATLGKCPEPVVDNDLVICLKQVTLTIKESQWATYQQMGAVKGKCPEAVDNDIIICMPKGREKVTMTIKESQWASYQNQGATLGECPAIIDNDLIICVPQGGSKVTMTIKESQWPQYQQMGASLGDCPIVDPELTICVRNGSVLKTIKIKESEWPAYQAQGAFLGECPVVVDPEITICLPLDNGTFQTLVIKQSQWESYKERGATIGTCRQVEEPKFEICVQNGKERITILITESMWADYQKMGATRGKCPEIIDKDVVICVTEGKTKITKTIKESQLESYIQMGATMGACPEIVDNDMVICIPQKTGNITKTIKESQWNHYKSLGASIGECPPVTDNYIEICVPEGKTRKTITIKESEWPMYERLRATLGKCPVEDKKIEICVTINGVRSTQSILESQWETFQQQGATRGRCTEVVDKDITICVREGRGMVTKVIKESQFEYYKTLGAKLGPCPVYDPEFDICILENGKYKTITIKESQWPSYQNQGAKIGACPETSVNEEQNSNADSIPSLGMMICILENGKYVTKTITMGEWRKYQQLGATRGACVDQGEKVVPAKNPDFRLPNPRVNPEEHSKPNGSIGNPRTPTGTSTTRTPIKRPSPTGGR